jgi:hypothetical protein
MRLNKRQRACHAANVIEGLTVITLTQKLVAAILGVSQPYVNFARTLPPGQRQAILCGLDSTPFTTLMKPVNNGIKPGKTLRTDITDAELVKAVRQIGVNRVLNAAIAAEAAE